MKRMMANISLEIIQARGNRMFLKTKAKLNSVFSEILFKYQVGKHFKINNN